MAAKPHSNFWGWASDHWFATTLIALFVVPTVVYLPVAMIGAAVRPKTLPSGSGTTPFPAPNPNSPPRT
jgi:hypothetical protein